MHREDAPDGLRDGSPAAGRRRAGGSSGQYAVSVDGAADAAADADRGPQVTLQFGASRRREVRAALDVCRDHGWRLSSSAVPPATSIVVPGQQAVHLLHRLAELEAGPEKVVIRSSDLPRLPVRALHEALPRGTTLEVSG